MRKVIGFLDESAGSGGTTRYLTTLISGLNRAEFEIVFFAKERRGWHSTLESMGVEIVTLADKQETGVASAQQTGPTSAAAAARQVIPPALSWWRWTLHDVFALKRLLKKKRVDLLHSNQAGAEPAPIAARLAGIPVILATWLVDSTYDLENVRSGPRYRLLEKWCMRSLDHAIAITNATATDWMRRCALPESYRDRITVIYLGIDVDRLVRRRTVCEAKASLGLSDRMVIGSMGRLEAAKGYEYLIRALPRVVARYPEVLVRIAGRGELQGKLTGLARELSVERNVELCGFTADIQSFLETIDVYVQPSLCEAQGLAILEAMSLEIPVIASKTGGIPECVKDSALIVPPKDPEALADAIFQLVEDPEARKSMGYKGRQNVTKRFRYQEMVAKTEGVYRLLDLPG
jgi:glycosyltransferase involved in cell wall biosynthesis